MIYNVNYDIAAIFIYVFILIVFFMKKEINKASNDLFFVLCCCGFIAAVSDIVSSVGNSYVEEWSYAARDVWNYKKYAYISVDLDGRYLGCNKTAAKIFPDLEKLRLDTKIKDGRLGENVCEWVKHFTDKNKDEVQ